MEQAAVDPGLYFDDGVRRVDFILTFSNKKDSEGKGHKNIRKIFESNLREEGLHLEHDDKYPGDICYLKIHAPWELLLRYAEILKFKMPIKKFYYSHRDDKNVQKGMSHSAAKAQEFIVLQSLHESAEAAEADRDSWWNIFYPDRRYIPKKDKRLNVIFSCDKEYIFDIPPKKEEFFSSVQRSQIIEFILQRKSFSKDSQDLLSIGINKLITDGVYLDAFPLHEGSLSKKDETNPRWLLKEHWASLDRMLKFQPLDQVREYFGVKIGLYFAWLGFYTYMLVPAAVVGVICFLYSLASFDYPSHEICEENKNILMCPACDFNCTFWHLGETCTYSKLSYLFDNPSTVFFAVFMSVWGTLFLELWKRYLARITFRWDLTDIDTFEEHPRPEYISRLSKAEKKKLNTMTKAYEPYVPFWSERLPCTILSISVVLLLVLLAFVAVLGVIVYRMSMRAATFFRNDAKMMSFAPLIVSFSAAFLNLIFIILFNQIYTYLAESLTELEKPRTQTEFDNSMTLKMFLLQFVNYYSSIFYIAFFKGKFGGHPGNRATFLGYQQEECGTGGCILELSIQLAIIMIGNQALNAVVEMGYPFVLWLYNQWKLGENRQQNKNRRPAKQWYEDYALADWGPRALFYEYLEMVVQFGFITIFVSAFPLAPFFALINNLLELRWDARKLLCSYRRAVGRRVKNIGIWYRILDSVAKLAVVSNAVILAFTSDFIPKQFYKYTISEDGSLKGYLNYSLSYFNTRDFESNLISNISIPSTMCRYYDFREPYWSAKKYDYRSDFWELLVARLAFIVVFENIIFTITTLLKWLIPDMPSSLKKQMRLQMYIVNDVIIQQELARRKDACKKRRKSSNPGCHGPSGCNSSMEDEEVPIYNPNLEYEDPPPCECSECSIDKTDGNPPELDVERLQYSNRDHKAPELDVEKSRSSNADNNIPKIVIESNHNLRNSSSDHTG